MTGKRWMRTLGGANLEMLAGQSPLGELAEAEIARIARKRERKAKILPWVA